MTTCLPGPGTAFPPGASAVSPAAWWRCLGPRSTLRDPKQGPARRSHPQGSTAFSPANQDPAFRCGTALITLPAWPNRDPGLEPAGHRKAHDHRLRRKPIGPDRLTILEIWWFQGVRPKHHGLSGASRSAATSGPEPLVCVDSAPVSDRPETARVQRSDDDKASSRALYYARALA